MKLNRIQQQIFKKLSKELNLTEDQYIEKYSIEYIEVQRTTLDDLSEAEGDTWINKAYLQSLG